MITLPESLLLFALDDARGTVHPACFLGLDTALRGAVLADLALGGHIRLESAASLTHRPEAGPLPQSPVLAYALAMLAPAPSPGPITAWLDRLAEGIPDLRQRLIDDLASRGALAEVVTTRSLLPSSTAHPMRDGTYERDMLDRVRESMQPRRTLSPRMGTLVGLIDAARLVDVLFAGDERDRARTVARWIRSHDPIALAVHEAVSRIEGTWEG
ncbi:MAG: hypothetical protein ACI8PZ_001284 [Myxococcota bacterium]|jgi:hypothetical protein